MTTYHHGDLKAALLRAASEVIETEGLSALSVREAARRAKVSHNAPYRHFRDRHSLVAALAAEGFQMLAEELEKSSIAERGAAYVRFALSHPNRFRLMFGAPLDREGRGAAKAAQDALVAGFRARPEVADPQTAAAAAWSLVHGLAQLILEGHFKSSDEFVRRVLGAIRFAAGAQRSA